MFAFLIYTLRPHTIRLRYYDRRRNRLQRMKKRSFELAQKDYILPKNLGVRLTSSEVLCLREAWLVEILSGDQSRSSVEWKGFLSRFRN